MDMTFEEWNQELQGMLKKFHDFWLEMHKSNPDVYPLSMLSGNWDEQFDLFYDMKRMRK